MSLWSLSLIFFFLKDQCVGFCGSSSWSVTNCIHIVLSSKGETENSVPLCYVSTLGYCRAKMARPYQSPYSWCLITFIFRWLNTTWYISTNRPCSILNAGPLCPHKLYVDSVQCFILLLVNVCLLTSSLNALYPVSLCLFKLLPIFCPLPVQIIKPSAGSVDSRKCCF